MFSQCSFRGLCLGVFLHSKLTDLIGQKNCADLCRFSARFTSWRSHRGLANCVHIPAWFEDVWTGTYSVYRCLQERLPGKMTCPHTKYKDMKTYLKGKGKDKRGRATLGVASNQRAVQVLSWSRQSPTNLSDLCANVPYLFKLEISWIAVDRDDND